jgi:hypothetical protein
MSRREFISLFAGGARYQVAHRLELEVLPLQSPKNASHFWIILLLCSGAPDLRMISCLSSAHATMQSLVSVSTALLRRVLASYTAYYNQTRTHLALQKDAPLRRAVRRSGAIVAIPNLAGLHHQYVRI